jgi:hypothetical protein|tara:strand:+ start:100 stop:321 length:222 start_codon:yes stop_codon:yes gene_type:complete
MDRSFSERTQSSFVARLIKFWTHHQLAGEIDDGVRPLVDVRETVPDFVSDGNFARCIWFCSIAGTSERLAMDG